MWAFNAERDRLAVDPFGGRTLSVNLFIGLTMPIQRIAQTSADTGGHGNGATAFASAFMMNGTRLFDEFILDVSGKERAAVLAALMFDDGDSSVGISEQQWHG